MITIYQRFTGNPSQPAVTVDGSGNVIPQDQVSTTQVMPGTADDYGQLKTQEILNPNMTFGGFQDPSGKVFNNTGTLTMADNAILQSIPGAGSVQKSDTVQGYEYVPADESLSTAGDDGWTKFWGDYGPLIAVGGAGGFLGAAALGAGALGAGGAADLGPMGADSAGIFGGSGVPASGGSLADLASSFNAGQDAANAPGLTQLASNAGTVDAGGNLATLAPGNDAIDSSFLPMGGATGVNSGYGALGSGIMPADIAGGANPDLGLGTGGGGVGVSPGYGAVTPGVTGSTAASTGSALSRVMDGTATAADYATLGLQALPGVLGAVGASQQAGALSDLADKQFAVGAPSRARYEAAMTPGFDPTTIPGYSGALASTSQAVLSKLSANGGNPYGNPGGLISANQQIVNGTALPAIQNYESQNAATGGYSAFNSAAPNTATSAIGANSGVLSALVSAASSVVNPPQPLAALLKQYGLGSSSTNTLSSLQ